VMAGAGRSNRLFVRAFAVCDVVHGPDRSRLKTLQRNARGD